LPELEKSVVELILGGEVMNSSVPVVSNSRHEDALNRALEHLRDARHTHESHMPADFVAIDLRAAVDVLGEITGETASEDLLEAIFSNFCIGK
jgi:tRNA modification GTPase